MNDRETWLASTAVELVGVSAAAFDEAAHIRLLVTRIAELLELQDVAALLADHDGRLTIGAATSHRARDLLALESRFDGGPCTACYHAGKRAYGVPVVQPEPDATLFADAVGRLGFHACSTLPLTHRDIVIGAVCALESEDGVSSHLLDLTSLLVEAATVGILHQRQLHVTAARSEQLQTALDSRIVIEQAKGVLAAKLDTSPQTGFEMLRGFARRNNRQLIDVAEQVVRGALTMGDLTGSERAR